MIESVELNGMTSGLQAAALHQLCVIDKQNDALTSVVLHMLDIVKVALAIYIPDERHLRSSSSLFLTWPKQKSYCNVHAGIENRVHIVS